MLEAKGVKGEIVREIAEAYVKLYLEDRKRREEEWPDGNDIESWNNNMSSVLLDVAELTLKTPNPFHPDTISYPIDEKLDDVLLHLQSKEAKDFIQKIKANLDQASRTEGVPFRTWHPEKLIPLTDDEIEVIRKIFEETKYQLEQPYRRKFHKLPPEDWHLYITD